MTQDEVIRVLLALAIGFAVFKIFRRPVSPDEPVDPDRARRPARLASVLFIFGGVLALLYMVMAADL